VAPPAPLRVPGDGYSWPELRELLLPTLREGLSALVLGHPGVGKSALAATLAEAMSLRLVDIRLAQQEPADLAGVWFPDRDRESLKLLPPEWVRRVCSEPAFVFLDEFNAAVTRLHQSVAYQVVLEHRLGPFAFHPDTVVLAAGNLAEDRALATSLSSALNNRFVHFVLRPDADSWVRWARSSGLDPRVVAYVEHHGARALYRAPRGESAFPSPRSWEMASRLMGRLPREQGRRAAAACVGRAAAEELHAFARTWARVRPEQVVRDGQIPDFRGGEAAEPSRVHATVMAVAEWLVARDGRLAAREAEHVAALLAAPGLEAEYRLMFLRRVWSRPELAAPLRACPSFREQASALVSLQLEARR
jgi:MoxR-like ATPase